VGIRRTDEHLSAATVTAKEQPAEPELPAATTAVTKTAKRRHFLELARSGERNANVGAVKTYTEAAMDEIRARL